MLQAQGAPSAALTNFVGGQGLPSTCLHVADAATARCGRRRTLLPRVSWVSRRARRRAARAVRAGGARPRENRFRRVCVCPPGCGGSPHVSRQRVGVVSRQPLSGDRGLVPRCTCAEPVARRLVGGSAGGRRVRRRIADPRIRIDRLGRIRCSAPRRPARRVVEGPCPHHGAARLVLLPALRIPRDRLPRTRRAGHGVRAWPFGSGRGCGPIHRCAVRVVRVQRRIVIALGGAVGATKRHVGDDETMARGRNNAISGRGPRIVDHRHGTHRVVRCRTVPVVARGTVRTSRSARGGLPRGARRECRDLLCGTRRTKS